MCIHVECWYVCLFILFSSCIIVSVLGANNAALLSIIRQLDVNVNELNFSFMYSANSIVFLEDCWACLTLVVINSVRLIGCCQRLARYWALNTLL